MEANLESLSPSEKAVVLLDKINAADVDAVRECLLRGVRPHSQVVDAGRESEHYMNQFVTDAMQLEDQDKRFEIVRLLLEHGVHPDHSVQFGTNTAQKMPILSYVIERFGLKGNMPQEVFLLLVHGADVNKRDFVENCPLDHAWNVGNEGLLKLLRLSGAKPIDLDDQPLRDDIRLLLTNVKQYKVEHQGECDELMEKINALRAEGQSRKRKADEQFSVDHRTPPRSPRSPRNLRNSPRKAPRKDDAGL